MLDPIIKGKSVPLQVWSGPEGSRKLRFPDYMTTAQDGGKVVSLTHRPPLPPGNVPGTHFCWRLSRPQGHSAIGKILCRWKIPVTPSGIEPATFRFVAQHLNHCATAVPVRPYYATLLIIRYTADLLQIYRCTDLVLSLNIREMKKCMLRCSYLVTMTFYFARAFCVFAHRYSYTNRKRAKPKKVFSNQCYTIMIPP